MGAGPNTAKWEGYTEEYMSRLLWSFKTGGEVIYSDVLGQFIPHGNTK